MSIIYSKEKCLAQYIFKEENSNTEVSSLFKANNFYVTESSDTTRETTSDILVISIWECLVLCISLCILKNIAIICLYIGTLRVFRLFHITFYVSI